MTKPLSSDDRRLLDLLPPGSNIQDAVWLHKQSGMRIIKHRYIELLAGAQAIQTVDLDVQYWPEKNAANGGKARHGPSNIKGGEFARFLLFGRRDPAG